MKLSILMPVYNERATLESAVKRVLDVSYPVDIELVIVDDGSTDGTRDLYPQWADEPRILMHEKRSNGGKGSAIRKLSLIHISEPTRRTPISYAVFCLK